MENYYLEINVAACVAAECVTVAGGVVGVSGGVAAAPGGGVTLADYAARRARQLAQAGRARTAETYLAASHSLAAFAAGGMLPLHAVTGEVMQRYERHLREFGLTKNTTSFYMRVLRAAYNRAVAEGLVVDARPFADVYTGVAPTHKRALSLDSVRALASLPCDTPDQALARDLFLFSFYTRGMSFVDMAYLPCDAVRDGLLHYRRRKTGQCLCVRWEPAMQRLLDRIARPGTPFLLPIIAAANGKERNQYRHVQCCVNRRLRALGERLGFAAPLTMYVARHSWASAAHELGAPLADISEGMGHASVRTTRIYVRQLTSAAVDDCNRRLIALLDPAPDTPSQQP